MTEIERRPTRTWAHYASEVVDFFHADVPQARGTVSVQGNVERTRPARAPGKARPMVGH